MIAGLLGVMGLAAAADGSVLDGRVGLSEPGWNVAVEGGFPWIGARVQAGLGDRLAGFVEADSALLNRVQPSVGVSAALLEGERGQLSVEALAGWQVQYGALPQVGPSAAVGLRTGARLGRWVPYLQLQSRFVLRTDRTVVVRADGEERSLERTLLWSPSVMGGLGLQLTEGFGLDAGLGYHRPDVGQVSAVIPAIRGGIVIGGKP